MLSFVVNINFYSNEKLVQSGEIKENKSVVLWRRVFFNSPSFVALIQSLWPTIKWI